MSSDSGLNAVIGERIRELRKKKGLTREALAERIDVSSRYLASLEWGQVGASIATLRKICLTLGVSSDYLLDISKNSGSFDEIRDMLSQLSDENVSDIVKIVSIFCDAVKKENR